MKPNEIKKDLEHEIHLAEYVDSNYCNNTEVLLIKSALAYINQLEAKVERYKDNLNAVLEERADENIKSDAIKDFVERLKNEIISETAYGCDINQHSGYYDYSIKIGDIPEYIDNLVKEMVGDEE